MNEYLNADTKDIFLGDERTDEFLAHHGIQGMKWGVSNGPPYPLSSAEHNKVVSKAKDAAKVAGSAIKKAGSATVKAAKKTKENIDKKVADKKAEKKEQEIRNLTPKTFTENKAKYSDEEVARIANRLRMEQQIADLGRNQTDKGSNFVSKTLKTTAENAFRDVATATATTMVERAFGSRDQGVGTMIREEFSRMRGSQRKTSTAQEKTIKDQANKIKELNDKVKELGG